VGLVLVGGQAYLLVARFLPLCDEHRVGVVVFEQPVVQRLGNGFFLVVQVIDVAGS
jgi:hypothetical protein